MGRVGWSPRHRQLVVHALQRHRRRRRRLRRLPHAGPVLRRRPRAPDALAHQRHRRVVVADDRRAQAPARGGGRGSTGDRARHRDPGVHQRHVGQGLPRAHPARGGLGGRHLLPPDATDGGPRRRGRAALLPVHRRPHRHRARPVQLRFVRLRPRARRGRTDRERDPRCLRDEGRDDGGLAEQGLARARARARHLGVRRHRLQGGVVAAGNRERRPAGYRRVPLRDAREADALGVLEPRVGRSPGGGDRVRAGDRPRAHQRGARPVVHGVSGSAGLLHALGRGVPPRRVRDRAARSATTPTRGRRRASCPRRARTRSARRSRTPAWPSSSPTRSCGRQPSSRGHHAKRHPRADERPRGVRGGARAALDGVAELPLHRAQPQLDEHRPGRQHRHGAARHAQRRRRSARRADLDQRARGRRRVRPRRRSRTRSSTAARSSTTRAT